MDSYFVRSDGLKLKMSHTFWLHKTLIDGLEWCVYYLWTIVTIVMFLSAVWSLILTAPIHCRGSVGEQVMQCYISPNEEIK